MRTNVARWTGVVAALSLTAGLIAFGGPARAALSTLSVSAGGAHSCAVTSDGAVRCWGSDADGQLGDDSHKPETKAVQVKGLSTGAVDVSAGGSHSCAVLGGGGVRCWGANNHGQLGNGNHKSSKVPVKVTGLKGIKIVAVSAGDEFTCALANNGRVRCWGSNESGQLGGFGGLDSSRPVVVLDGAASVSAGDSHACVVTTSGGAKCWGYNDSGQLGDGNSSTSSPDPVDVTGLSSGVTAISAGTDHTCAVASGAARCWGGNLDGQVGDGSTQERTTPVAVTGLSSGVTAITAGRRHTCAIVGGAARCWGAEHRLGDGTGSASSTSVAVMGLTSGVDQIVAGGGHTCAVAGGTARCWGINAAGQLGDGSKDTRDAPVDVKGLSGVPPEPKITDRKPGKGPVGTTVVFTGRNFTGTTDVSFNGTSATTFKVVNDKKLSAVVPPGATTGKITVTTPGGSATSKSFTVT